MFFNTIRYPQYETRKIGRVSWLLRNGFSEDTLISMIPLFSDEALCIRRMDNKRKTLKVKILEEFYFVKIFFYGGLISKIIALIKAKGGHEFHMNRSLDALGINVPFCVAYGQEKLLGLTSKEYLITKEVTDSYTAADYRLNIFRKLPYGEQLRVIRAFVAFIRDLHSKGIEHYDLHVGNILVKSENDNHHFYLLDLYESGIKHPLRSKDILKNLVRLNLMFYITVEDSLKYYFFRTYFEGRMSKREKKESLEKINRLSLRLAVKRWTKRRKRCLQTNSDFHRTKTNGTFIHVKKGRDDIKEIVMSPDIYLSEKHGSVVIKTGCTVTASKVSIEASPNLFLKRYDNKGFKIGLKYLFRSSRAKKVWINSYSFEIRGIPVLTPIAFMETRKYGILKCSYLLSDYVVGSTTLNRFAEQWNDIPYKSKQMIMRSLGRLIRKMHYYGCFHGNLTWNNIILKQHDTRYRFYFSDLDGSKVKKILTYKERVKDIGRFYLEFERYMIDPELQNHFMNAYYSGNHITASKDFFHADVLKRAGELGRSKSGCTDSAN